LNEKFEKFIFEELLENMLFMLLLFLCEISDSLSNSMFDEFSRFFSELLSVIFDESEMDLFKMILLLELGANKSLALLQLENFLNNRNILFLHLSNVKWTDRTGTEAERLFVKDLLLIILSLNIANGGIDDERGILGLSILLETLSPPAPCKTLSAFWFPVSPTLRTGSILANPWLMSMEKAGQTKIYAIFTFPGNTKKASGNFEEVWWEISKRIKLLPIV
jgi:hypothetical protein